MLPNLVNDLEECAFVYSKAMYAVILFSLFFLAGHSLTAKSPDSVYNPGWTLRKETCIVQCECPPESDIFGWELVGQVHHCDPGPLLECCLVACTAHPLECNFIPDICHITL